MFCPKCGTANADTNTVCTNCGQPLAPAQAPQQPQYQQPQYQQPYQQAPYQQDPKGWYNGHPMGWYKFLIYFALFASCVGYAITGIVSFVSIGSYSTYEYFGVSTGFLKFWCVVYGLAVIALAVFAIIVRNALASLKAVGPKFLLYLYCAAAGLSIINFIITMATLGSVFSLLDAYFPGTTAGVVVGFIFSLAISVVMIILNKIYFDKRKDIFVK